MDLVVLSKVLFLLIGSECKARVHSKSPLSGGNSYYTRLALLARW